MKQIPLFLPLKIKLFKKDFLLNPQINILIVNYQKQFQYSIHFQTKSPSSGMNQLKESKQKRRTQQRQILQPIKRKSIEFEHLMFDESNNARVRQDPFSKFEWIEEKDKVGQDPDHSIQRIEVGKEKCPESPFDFSANDDQQSYKQEQINDNDQENNTLLNDKDDLEMYDLKPFYDEIKKFKLYSILTRNQKKKALSENHIYKNLHQQSLGEDQIKKQDIAKDTTEKFVDTLTLGRRLIRIFYHIGILVAVILIFVYGSKFTVRKRTINLSGIQNNQYRLNIRLCNSQLVIMEGVGSDIVFSYDALLRVDDYLENNMTQTQLDIGTVNDQFNINLIGGYDKIQYCVATLFIPPNLIWQEVNITCDDGSICYMVSDVPGFTVNNTMNIQGLGFDFLKFFLGASTMYANFKEIITDRFNYSSPVGALIIGNFYVNTYLYTFLQSGPVMIQSEKDFNLRFNVSFQALCGSSPNLGPNITSQCFIQGNNASSFFNQSTKCTGQVRLCVDGNSTCSVPLLLTPLQQALLNYQNALTPAQLNKTYNELQNLGIIDVKQASSDFQVSQIPDESGIQQVEIICQNGGLYANALSKKLGLPFGNEMFKSGLYDQPLSFSPDFRNQILSKIQQIPAGADFIFSLNIGGPKSLQANDMTFWTFFTNPAFAQLKPWWLSTLSGTALTAETINLSGFLAPGICPFQSQPTIELMLEMQSMIQNLFEIPTGLTAFIQQVGMPIVPETNKDQYLLNQTYSTVRLSPNNISHFINGDSEDWYSIGQSGHDYVLQAVTLSNNTLILNAVALSFLASFIISYLGINIVKAAFVVLNDNLLEKAEHHGDFCQSTRKKKKDQQITQDSIINLNVANIFDRSRWTVFLGEASRFSSTVDYYAYITISKFLVDSSFEFYKLLFRPVINREELEELKDNGDQSIGENELKNLYEKFCYLNHYSTLSLSDPAQVLKLSKFGFQIVDDIDQAQAFSKLSQKNTKEIFEPEASLLVCKNTLEIFIETNYNITTISADIEWNEDFQKKYQKFCKKNCLIAETILIEEIASRFNLDIIKRPRKKVLKIIQSSQQNYFQELGFNRTSEKIMHCFKRLIKCILFQKKSIYVIDRQLIKYHFKILTNPQKFANRKLEKSFDILTFIYYFLGLNKFKTLTKREMEKTKPLRVLLQTIYYRYWFIQDFIIVAINSLIVLLLVFPSFILVFLSKIEYAPFSLYHESDLLTSSDLIYSPWIIFIKFLSFETYIQCLIILLFEFMFIIYFQDLFMYYNQKFPEDASFRGKYIDFKASGPFKRALSFYQWLFLFIMLFVIFFYVSLVAIWMLLGAIINPNNYLVYTSSVSTLITICTSKLKEMEKLYDKGILEVQIIVDQIYQSTVKAIANALVTGTQQAVFLIEEGSQDLGLTLDMKKVLASLEGLNDPEMIKKKVDEQQKVLKDSIKNIFIEQLKQLELPQDLCILLPQLLLSNEDQFTIIISDFFEKLSGGVLNSRLMKWFIDQFSLLKQQHISKDDPKQLILLENKLQSSHKQLIEACIETFFTVTFKQKIESEKVLQFQKIVVETISLLLSLQEGNNQNLLGMIKSIILLCPKKDENEQNSFFIFIKVVELIDLYQKKQLDQNKILAFFKEVLESFKLPSNVGMLLTIMFSKGSNFYQYGQFIINGEQQISFFVISLLRTLMSNEGMSITPDLNTILQFMDQFYQLVIKLSVYKANSEDIKMVFKPIIQFIIKKYLEYLNNLESKQQNEQFDSQMSFGKDIPDKQIRTQTSETFQEDSYQLLLTKFSKQSLDVLENFLSFSAKILPLLLIMNKDWYREIDSITTSTGINKKFIQDLCCLGTRSVWNIISSFDKQRGTELNALNMYSSRSAQLESDNDIFNCISKNLRMEPRVLIGMFEIMHCEVDDGSNHEYLDEFFEYVCSDQVLRIKDGQQRQCVQLLIKVLCSTNYDDFLQAYNLLSEKYRNSKTQAERDYGKQQCKNLKDLLIDSIDSNKRLIPIFVKAKFDQGQVEIIQNAIKQARLGESKLDQDQFEILLNAIKQAKIFGMPKLDQDQVDILTNAIKQASILGIPKSKLYQDQVKILLNAIKQDPESKDNFLSKNQMGFFDAKIDDISVKQNIRQCSFYSIVTENDINKNKLSTIICDLLKRQKKDIEKTLTLVRYLSQKATIKPISQVELFERAKQLAYHLNMKTESLIHLANLILFESVEMISSAVTYFCQSDLQNFEEKMNQLSKHENEAKNKKVFQDKVSSLARILIDIDNVFDPSNIQPMMDSFLPDWLKGSQEILLNTVLETSFNVGKSAKVKLINNVLDLFNPIFYKKADSIAKIELDSNFDPIADQEADQNAILKVDQKPDQYKLFKEMITALISRQDDLVGNFFQQAQIQLQLKNDSTKAAISVIKALNNDNIISLLTLAYVNMSEKSRDFYGQPYQPLAIMANTLAALMVRNHQQITQIFKIENEVLFLSSNRKERLLKWNVLWNVEFIWIVGNLKHFFTTEQKAFSDYAIVLFEKVFKHDSINQSQITQIMSIYSDSPNLDQIASMLKIPTPKIEFANLLCRLTMSKQKDKLSLIGELSKPNVSALLKNSNINVAQFSYLMKFVTRNLSASNWREFLVKINLGEGSNMNIIKSLLALTVDYDNMIPDDYDKLKQNYVSYFEMRKYLFLNFGGGVEIMELIFNLKRGNINNLKFMNEDNQLLKNQTNLFGSSSKIVEIVSAIIAMIVQDPGNLFKDYNQNKIQRLLSSLDKPYYTRNNFESALYLLYIHLGISPLVILAILGNKEAAHMIDSNLKTQNFKWKNIKKLIKALKNYKIISHFDRLKVMECEFFSLITGILTEVGLDILNRNSENTEGQKIQKENLKSFSSTMITFLSNIIGQQQNTQDDKEKFDYQNLSELFKINPKRNKNLWAVNSPVIAIMLITQIKIMRDTIKNKKVDGAGTSEQKTNMQYQRSIQFTMSIDFIFSLIERMLYIDHHNDLKGFNKAAIVQLLFLVFQNKKIQNKKGTSMIDILPLTVFEFVCYPSLYSPYLTDRYYRPYLQYEPVQIPDEGKNKLSNPSNPFLIDFSKVIENGWDQSLQDDPDEQRKAVCKILYQEREIYQQCFMRLISEVSNSQIEQSSDDGQKIITSKQYTQEKPDQELKLLMIVSTIGYCGEYNEEDDYQEIVEDTSKGTETIFSDKIDRQLQKYLDSDYFGNFKSSRQYKQSLVDEIKKKKKHGSSSFNNEICQLSLKNVIDEAIKRKENPLCQELLNNLEEQQKLFAYLINIRPESKKIFSKKPAQLKKLIKNLNVKNSSFFSGSDDTIDLVIKLIEYLQGPEKKTKQIIVELTSQVDLQSNSKGLGYLLTFIIDPKNVDEDTLSWIIEECFGGKKEIVYGIMLPLLRILKEKYNSNIELSQNLKYLTYGDEIKLEEIRAYPQSFQDLQKNNHKMRANSELVGEALEDLITQIQSIPQEQRSFFKIIIRCYSGEIEAWVSLLDILNLYETFPSSQKGTVQNLFMQMLLGFKGLNIRGQNTWMELKNKTMLELISKSKQKKIFLKIFKQTLPKDHVSKFSDFQKILVLFVDKNFTSLIDEVPKMMGFLIKEQVQTSQKERDSLKDLNSLIQLSMSFVVFNKLNESQLMSILNGFSEEFKTEFIDFQDQDQDYQFLIMALMRFTQTNDLSVIHQLLLESEEKFESVHVDTVKQLKYFLSINLLFKLKYSPNMLKSIHLNNFSPASLFPIYQFVEGVLGEDQLNRIIPGYSIIFKESLQDVFFHLVQVQREITRNIDLKSSSNLISPLVLSFFQKKILQLQKYGLVPNRAMQQDPSQEQEFILLQGQINHPFQSLTETLKYIIEKTPNISFIVVFGGQFLTFMIGQLGFVQLMQQMPEFLEIFLASELKLFKKETKPQKAENSTEESRLLEENQVKLLDEEKVKVEGNIKILTNLISNLYGLVTSPHMNQKFYSNTIEYLGALLGNEDLKNILELVGEYRNDSFIDQKKISSLCESLLSTLTDTNCLVSPYIQESDDQKTDEKKTYIKKQIGKITQFASSYNKIKVMLKDASTNGINETVIVDGVIELLSILMDENETQKLVLIIHTVISLFHKRFEEIDEKFFLLLKVSPEKTKVIVSLLKNFNLSMKNPLKVLEQKGSELITKYLNPASKRWDNIKVKISGSENLSKEDLFCLIDISKDGKIDIDEFQTFLKRTGINLTEHKLLEIFTSVKGSVTSKDSELKLDLAEFEKAMEYIQKQSIQLTMESLGITKEILTFALIYLLFLIIILFAFILVGIKAFSVPTVFGSVINSLFPIIGGGGVAQAKKADVEKLFDPRKLKEITEKCMKIIQQMKI